MRRRNMYLFINALILALLAPVTGVKVAEAGPTCRAEIRGMNLLTTVQLPTGVAVEGPWRITHSGDDAGPGRFTVLATLDHVIETDEFTGDRSVTPFPRPVQLAFEGDSQEEIVRRAARVWCVTVMRAQENQMLDHLAEPTQTRITAVATAPNAA
jgi:hypothetical protein